MLKTVRLKLLPSVANCLSWSAEGSLAVIAGEDVIILVLPPSFLLGRVEHPSDTGGAKGAEIHSAQ